MLHIQDERDVLETEPKMPATDKINNSLGSMLRARGYVTSDFRTSLLPLPSWIEIDHVTTPDAIVLVTYQSLKKNIAKRIVELLDENNVVHKHKIMVADGGSKQSIAYLLAHGIEFVPLSLLRFDRSIHFLVPTYRILSTIEREEVLSKYSTRVADWPKILLSDPQVIYMGAATGDLMYNISDNIYRTVIDPL
jgi:DNA-directed RNA polymerase subunit H (RpoH/RPB5)